MRSKPGYHKHDWKYDEISARNGTIKIWKCDCGIEDAFEFDSAGNTYEREDIRHQVEMAQRLHKK